MASVVVADACPRARCTVTTSQPEAIRLIENTLHWVCDVTFGEDRSAVRTGAGPRIMAALRNAEATSADSPGTPTSPPRHYNWTPGAAIDALTTA